MMGKEPSINDLEINLEEHVLPANLLSNEVLSSDEETQEEEEREPFQIDTSCAFCEAGVRVFVLASPAGIRTLQQLLLAEISISCPGCSRNNFRHGRPQ